MITVKVYSYITDRHGDKTKTAERVINGCMFVPSGASKSDSATRETEGDNDQVIRDGRLAIPPGVLIGTTEKVVLPDNTEWNVIGESQQYVHPWSGWAPGGEVTIRRVTG